MSHLKRIAALEQALRQAIAECEAHNSGYHHLTSPGDLNEWKALLPDVGHETVTIAPTRRPRSLLR